MGPWKHRSKLQKKYLFQQKNVISLQQKNCSVIIALSKINERFILSAVKGGHKMYYSPENLNSG